MRRLILALAVTLAIGGGVALAQTGSPPPASPAASAVPSPAASPISTIHIKNFAYVPSTVTIKAGQTVRFVQDDQTPHTVTASDKSFDSGNLDQKATWNRTFAKAGTYAYFCAYHPSMKGTVIVE